MTSWSSVCTGGGGGGGKAIDFVLAKLPVRGSIDTYIVKFAESFCRFTGGWTSST